MSYIKNINHEQVFQLAEQVSVQPKQIVSKTLVQNSFVNLTIFAFSKGEGISTHDSNGDAMVLILEGIGQFKIDGIEYACKKGDTLIMPAKKPHSVHAEEDFKMMLTVVFPVENN